MTGIGLSGTAPDPLSPVLEETGAKQRFRPDLEGLRAVAVLLVLLFHAAVPGFAGGFVGVDVFFVLSGFLITGLIVRELSDTGTLSLTTFYARRARRLLPAALVALVVTVAVSALLLPPLRVPDIAADGAAAALYVSNLRFAFLATDYLAAEMAPSPLLHYWSLGVEEQFYLFWPALLLVVARLTRGSMRALLAVIAVVTVGSFALSVVLTDVAAPWAFYSLPTRAWELAMGALVALAAHRALALPPLVAAAAGVAGIALIVLAGVVIDTGTRFPGTAALLPTVGAALVIAAGLGGLPAPARVLSLPPLRWIGRISYSLYLWHWPVLVIPTALSADGLPLWQRVALAVATVPIAAASHRWVEEPIRRGRLVRRPASRTLALAGALSLVAATASVGIGVMASPVAPGGGVAVNPDEEIRDVLGTPGLPASPRVSPRASPDVSPEPGATPDPTGSPETASPAATAPSAPTTPPGGVPPDLAPPLAAAKDDLPRVYEDGCHVTQLDTTLPPCEYGDLGSSTTVVLFGDSHAAQWFPALERLAHENGWRLLSMTKGLCAVVDHPVWHGRFGREYTECTQWRNAALARIAAERPALVVVGNSKFATLAIGGGGPDPSTTMGEWRAALARILVTLGESGANVAVIGDTPQASVDPPVCLSANLDDALACATPAAEAVPTERLIAERDAAADAGATFIDPTPWVCPTEPCPAVIGSLLVYFDGGHITSTFSRALAPYLAAVLPLPTE